MSMNATSSFTPSISKSTVDCWLRHQAGDGEGELAAAPLAAQGIGALGGVDGEVGVIGVVIAQPEGREGEADEAHGQPDDGDDGLELVALHAAHGNGDVMAKHFHFRS